MFCRYFILRPVLSSVIAIVLIIAGLVAMRASPVEQYPNIVPPTLTVTAIFPGASSAAIADAVAAPIEFQMSGVAHMIYMQSSSSTGDSTYVLNIYFEVGTNLELVEADVLNRISTAMPQLPFQVQQQGITVRMMNPDLFLIIPFFSKTGAVSSDYVSNYLLRYVYPLVSQVRGVGVAILHGQRVFAMRAILDTNKMNYYNVSTKDIVDAVNDQNMQYAIGQNAMEPMKTHEKFNFVINPPGFYKKIDQLKNTVIRADQDSAQVVKVGDVADVKMEAQNYTTYLYFMLKDKLNKVHAYQGTALLVYLIPGANQIYVKGEIAKVLKEIKSHMPKGINFFNLYDSSEFIELSVKAVVNTLFIAFLLVFVVVMLFIQNFRGTMIPILAIPVSIIGAFAFTYVLGFSINTLTLFGMVLAIGMVVDDAIVVLECTERIMKETKCSSVDAAIAAMKEVAAPVMAIVLVLNAVFIPVAFLGGFSGVLMKQFAVTIAISVTLSGLVALTLTPMLCAVFLKHIDYSVEKQKNLLYRTFDSGFQYLTDKYMQVVTWTMGHIQKTLILWGSICLCVILLFMKVPTGLIPLEDMGYFYNRVQVAAAGSLDYTAQEAKKIARKMMKLPYMDKIGVIVGMDVADNNTNKTNTATLNSILKPYEDRPGKSQNVNAALAASNKIDTENKNVNGLAFNQPPIRGMSPLGGVTFYLQARRPVSVKTMHRDSVKLVKYLEKNYPAVATAQQFYEVDTPQLYIDVDARKTYLYGVKYEDIFHALQSSYGNFYINFFTKWNNLYWIILQGEYRYRSVPELMETIYVKAKDGSMIPIGSLASIQYKTGPEVVTRLNDFLASQIVVNPDTKHGYTQGQVMDAIRDAAPKVIGKKYSVQWFGPSYQENLAGDKSVAAVVFGLVMVFLILSALYEMWSLPCVVLFALPCALFGAMLALFIFQKPNDIYFQISLLALIGLSAKNVILIVEAAYDKLRVGEMGLQESALYAAKVRFRPIIMTSLAFIFGAVPLVTATGAGAHAQHSVGTGIIGGMLGSTCLATLFTPLFFTLVMRNYKPKNIE
ncbi:MAG: efflux RND transporter permease subunit [Gammaproteobacteria bacterium]|nr:efflux RND transporter permease subunit [Gammaproteobacteria bacterium]